MKGLDDARQLVEAGATRIGASVGVRIAQAAAGVESNGVAAAAYGLPTSLPDRSDPSVAPVPS